MTIDCTEWHDGPEVKDCEICGEEFFPDDSKYDDICDECAEQMENEQTEVYEP